MAAVEKPDDARIGGTADKAADDAPVALRPAAPIVPRATVERRALLVVISIMAFIAAVAIGLAATIWAASAQWQSDIGREVTVQVMPVEGGDLALETDAVIGIASAFPGVISARALDDDEIAALLEPWIGDSEGFDALPVPALVVIEIDPATPPDIAALTSAITGRVANTAVDDHALWQDRLKLMARTLVAAGIGILALVLVALVLSVTFATRGAMAANRDIVEVLHFVGANPGYIARQFSGHFLWLGLKAGAIGSGAAIILFAAMSGLTGELAATPAGAQITALFGDFTIGPAGYGLIALLAPVVAVLTALTSRREVMTVLGELDRDES